MDCMDKRRPVACMEMPAAHVAIRMHADRPSGGWCHWPTQAWRLDASPCIWGWLYACMRAGRVDAAVRRQRRRACCNDGRAAGARRCGGWHLLRGEVGHRCSCMPLPRARDACRQGGWRTHGARCAHGPGPITTMPRWTPAPCMPAIQPLPACLPCAWPASSMHGHPIARCRASILPDLYTSPTNTTNTTWPPGHLPPATCSYPSLPGPLKAQREACGALARPAVAQLAAVASSTGGPPGRRAAAPKAQGASGGGNKGEALNATLPSPLWLVAREIATRSSS